jgi:hypothetical protein
MFDIAEPTKITRAGKEGLTDAEEVKLTNIVADLYHLTTWHWSLRYALELSLLDA